jgi:hypothetical protein
MQISLRSTTLKKLLEINEDLVEDIELELVTRNGMK